MDGVFVHWTECRFDHNTWGTSWKIKWDDDGQILILMILTQTTGLQGISPCKFVLSVRWLVLGIMVYGSPPYCGLSIVLSCRGYSVGWRAFSLQRYLPYLESSKSEVEEISWWWREINPCVSGLCVRTNNSWITSLISSNINSSLANMSTII